MQDQDFKLYSRPISLTKLKKREMREEPFKTIIYLCSWQSTLGGNDQYKGATLCLEEKILEKEMVISFNQTRGHFGLQKTAWSFQQVTPNVSSSETRSNEWSSQIIWRVRKSLASKWVTMGITMVELCKKI
jgi:hypothetical protein